MGRLPSSTDPIDKIMSRVLDTNSDCWHIPCKNRYPVTRLNSLNTNGQLVVKASRYVYEFYYGPIPHGLVIDHLCRNTRCVFPGHLEVVTVLENLSRRKNRPYSDYCRSGKHLWIEENLYKINDFPAYYTCKLCIKERDKKKL